MDGEDRERIGGFLESNFLLPITRIWDRSPIPDETSNALFPFPPSKQTVNFIPNFYLPFTHTHIYMYLIYIVFILNLGYKNTIYVERKVNGKHEHPPPQYYFYVIFQRFSRLKSWEIKRSRIEKLFFFFISHESWSINLYLSPFTRIKFWIYWIYYTRFYNIISLINLHEV